jgi:hypothetical protein
LSAGEELAREALRASMALNGDPVAARREERKRAMSDGKVKFDPDDQPRAHPDLRRDGRSA